jgi:hypothetical protein
VALIVCIMAGSGIIYAAIVAAWVAYLVPSWVRHGEERTHAERSTERMRILQPGPRHGSHELDEEDLLLGERAVTRVSARTARRRRRTLLLLVVTITAVCIGVRLGYLLSWVPAIPAIALVGYLVLLRRSTRRMALARRRELARRAVRAVSVAPRRRVEPRPVVSPASAAPSPVRRPSTPMADDSWEPQPVPLPTYVTAPKARRSIRTINLRSPGAWTSGRLPGESDGHVAPAEAPRSYVSEAAETGPIPLQVAVGN